MERSNYYDNTISFNDFISKTMLIMSVGLITTMTTALVASEFIDSFFTNHNSLATVSILFSFVLEVVFVTLLTRNTHKLSKMVAYICFGLYSLINGYVLTYIFRAYTKESIAITFGLCAILFFSMSIIGHTTKINLLKYTSLIRLGLISLIISSFVCIFFFNDFLNWAVSCAGIILFLLLIAYDSQKLRDLYNSCYSNPELYSKLAIIGALELYLDFINLFTRILRIFGKRRD